MESRWSSRHRLDGLRTRHHRNAAFERSALDASASDMEACRLASAIRLKGESLSDTLKDNLMPTRDEFNELAALRLREAETLFQAELYDGAAYVCEIVRFDF